MYITSYIIIDLYFLISLLLETSGYINGFINIIFILAFIYGIHFNTKDKGLRYYLEIVWSIFSLLPFGIRIAIFIRLYLLSYHLSDFALDYILNMLPNHSDFGTILGPTVAGPGGSNLPPTGGGGSNLPPGGGSNLPPTGGESNLPPTGSATTNSILASIQHKLVLQAQERHGNAGISIYSGLHIFSSSAVLTPEERYELGQLVGHDELNGTSGIYNTIMKETERSSHEYGLRVVRNPYNRPITGSLNDTHSTALFRHYLTKFN